MNDSQSKDIKAVDVYRLNTFVGKYVDVKLKNLKNGKSGVVYTIDPVSESVVLLSKDQGNKLSASIIMNHAVEEIKIEDKMPENIVDIDLSTIFTNRRTSSSPKADLAMKKYVLKWFTLSNIPFTEDSNVILVEDVAIHPPYGIEDCISSFPVKLKSVQNLIRTVRQLAEAKDSRLLSPCNELSTT